MIIRILARNSCPAIRVVQRGVGAGARVEPARLPSAFARGALEPDVEIKDSAQVDEPEQEQHEDERRRPELHRGLAALASFTLVHCYPPFRRKCMARSAAGPSRMTQSVGKMHPSIGSSILSEAFAPRSWAVTSRDRKSTRLNSSHRCISYAVFC